MTEPTKGSRVYVRYPNKWGGLHALRGRDGVVIEVSNRHARIQWDRLDFVTWLAFEELEVVNG